MQLLLLSTKPSTTQAFSIPYRRPEKVRHQKQSQRKPESRLLVEDVVMAGTLIYWSVKYTRNWSGIIRNDIRRDWFDMASLWELLPLIAICETFPLSLALVELHMYSGAVKI